MTAPPWDGPLTFSEELLVILLNDERRSLASLPRPAIDCALAGAVLMDLAFANWIDTGLETLFVVDRAPTGNPLLDPVLAKIAAREKTADTLAWLRELGAEDAVRICEQAQVLLVQRGILELPEGIFIPAFTRCHETLPRWRKFVRNLSARRHRRIEREVGQRVGEALLSDGIPDPRDAALIGLVDACKLLGNVFPDHDVDRLHTRVEELRRQGLIGSELASAISEIERGIVQTLAEDALNRMPACDRTM